MAVDPPRLHDHRAQLIALAVFVAWGHKSTASPFDGVEAPRGFGVGIIAMRWKWSIAAGIVGFVFFYWVFKSMLPPPICTDGWHSPSIGRSGACSHHGGVHRPYAWIALLGSITGGIAVGC